MSVRQFDDRTVTALVADAVLAPSMHNAQPWSFHYMTADGVLHLRADLERAMPRTDPDHRALHIGCGAALFNLRVGAAHLGLVPEARLVPDADDPQLLAAVRLWPGGADAAPDAELSRLYPAIRRRHTSRYPFAELEIPQPVRETLQEAAEREGAELAFAHPWHADFLLELVYDAECRDVLDPAAREELERWTRLGADADTAVDGVPEYAFGPRKSGGKAPWRDFAGRRPTTDRGATAFEYVPQLALLSTRGDEPADWLRAGQALERVLLGATLADLATSLTSHALESRDLRSLTQDPVSGTGQVQMVLRLGYGPQGPATPRRPVRDVLTVT
ncbi:nitroreductase [Streptomyces albiflavescens]|uniref:Nitroreductase n=1 Tax=Streptomyces albiflavescens TaxID=1623582 RepID=A0A918D8B1_9ACTN|nr:nitroreductase [Streptomyces albiflavescens]GGN84921.1 nitroreductase [Streptomyces albiflavescens]